MNEYSIGVDLGGTNLRAAAVDQSGKMLDKIAVDTNLAAGPDAVLSHMVGAIQELRTRFGQDSLAGVGVGVPGFILFDEGIIVGANNLPQFEHYPMRDQIEGRLGSRGLLENDANAAALGEKWI